MAIDAGDAAIRAVIVNALLEQGEMGGRGLDALFAMRQAEAIVKALGTRATKSGGAADDRSATPFAVTLASRERCRAAM
jgi:hypothetical protein